LIYGGVATSDNDEWNILLKSILELGVIGIIRGVDPELLFRLIRYLLICGRDDIT